MLWVVGGGILWWLLTVLSIGKASIPKHVFSVRQLPRGGVLALAVVLVTGSDTTMRMGLFSEVWQLPVGDWAGGEMVFGLLSCWNLTVDCGGETWKLLLEGSGKRGRFME